MSREEHENDERKCAAAIAVLHLGQAAAVLNRQLADPLSDPLATKLLAEIRPMVESVLGTINGRIDIAPSVERVAAGDYFKPSADAHNTFCQAAEDLEDLRTRLARLERKL